MTLGTLIIVVVVMLLALMTAAWWVARRVKKRLDRAVPGAKHERRTVRVSPGCVQRLRVLTGDPLLLKLGDSVLGYQIGQQPMTPAVLAPGDTRQALREVSSALVTEFGARWVVVVRPASDESLMVDRIS